MRFELTCAQCGENRFDYPLVLTDDNVITCAECGHEIGTVAQLQQKVVEALTRQSANLMS